MKNMTTRERFQALMQFQPFDRLPLVEWATWWGDTLDRWRTEGLAEDFSVNPSDPLEANCQLARFFGHDLYIQDWLPISRPGCPQPAFHGAGIIRSIDDYEKILPYLYPEPSEIVSKERWTYRAELQKRGDAVLWITLEGFFWFSRQLLGIEPHLYAFYDEPKLMHRINSDLVTWQIKCIDAISEICAPDFMTFAEDMSYNHGPMLSEELFDEFMLPYYRQVLPRLKEHGTFSIIDSDGDISTAARWFERAGLEGILPLERQAGVDIAQLRKDHPRMRFIGHFDKMTMNKGEAVMRAEFERLVPTAAKGGFVVSVDHQTPPGVSYQEYQLFMKLFREYAEAAGRLSQTL